jgi:hypothetical protein
MQVAHPRRRGVVFAVAGAGLVLGHWLTYVIGMPDQGTRDHVLANTGHGYFAILAQASIVAGIAALAVVFLGRLMRRDDGWTSSGTFLWLAAFQVAAFASMEVTERLLAGAPLGELIHAGILPIGLVVQIAMAAVGALVLRAILRAADAIGSISMPLPRAAGDALGWFTAPLPPRAQSGRRTVRLRAPPLALP